MRTVRTTGMRRQLKGYNGLYLVLLIILGSMPACTDIKPLRVMPSPDGTLEYVFQNNTICHKTADYTKYNKTEGTLKVKEILEGQYSSEDKFDKVKQRNSQVEEVEAALFDICYEYAQGRMRENQYTTARDAYEAIRQQLIAEPVRGGSHGAARKPLHDGMVMIPAGDFIMGTGKDEITKLMNEFQSKHPRMQRWFFEDELPRRTVNIGQFWIDKYEVTNADYEVFVKSREGQNPGVLPAFWLDGNFPPGKRLHPVIGIDKFQALAYCQFRGKRLPAEVEWEKAARGVQGSIYPWGDKHDVEHVNTAESGRHDTTEVGASRGDVSYFNVFDMGGNVLELVQDVYAPYPGNDAGEERAKEAFERRRGWAVARGGSYDSEMFDARGASRRYFSLTHRGKDIGFRCVAD